MDVTHKIEACWYCPLRERNADGMYCDHPIWEKSDNPYDSMIITQDNLEGIPEKCPLKDEKLNVEYKL